MEAYFDNSATTRVLDEVKDIVVKTMTEDFGNPSSLHRKGVEAENYVKDAREKIAKSLKVSEKEIFFTSGGTESNNLAIIGTAMANKRTGMHIITSSIEHASVGNPMNYLEQEGFRITYLPVDHNGMIDRKVLEESLCEDTILVSVIHVNNEIGAVEPIDEIAAYIKKKNPNTLFHVDAIQSYGKYILRPKKIGIDLLSVSAHKIHGPKGVGFLYINEKVKVKPIIYGGDQQKGVRSGTENVPGIAGLAVAAQRIYEEHESKVEHLYRLREAFIQKVSEIEGITVNGYTDRRNAPHIVSVSFEGVKSEVLIHALEEKEIYASPGSACSSNKPSVNHTLNNIGVKKELLDSTLRFSFSVFNTEEEISYCISVLEAVLPKLRRFRRR